MIPGQQVQRQIDPRRDPGRGIELAVLHVQAISLDLRRRAQRRERSGIAPMSRHCSPFEQACPGEHERAVADRAEPLRQRAGIAQPGIEGRAEIHERQLRPTGHQQQVVRPQRLAEMPMGIEG
ncbi:hypothetical protein D3C84_1009360 [compost metagenome]